MSRKLDTSPCDGSHARKRLADARSRLEIAEVAEAGGSAADAKTAIMNACQAAIAAADAACCHALGRRYTGAAHDQAPVLLKGVRGGEKPARDLARALKLKNLAEYGIHDLAPGKPKEAIRWATSVVAFAEQVLER